MISYSPGELDEEMSGSEAQHCHRPDLLADGKPVDGFGPHELACRVSHGIAILPSPRCTHSTHHTIQLRLGPPKIRIRR